MEAWGEVLHLKLCLIQKQRNAFSYWKSRLQYRSSDLTRLQFLNVSSMLSHWTRPRGWLLTQVQRPPPPPPTTVFYLANSKLLEFLCSHRNINYVISTGKMRRNFSGWSGMSVSITEQRHEVVFCSIKQSRFFSKCRDVIHVSTLIKWKWRHLQGRS